MYLQTTHFLYIKIIFLNLKKAHHIGLTLLVKSDNSYIKKNNSID